MSDCDIPVDIARYAGPVLLGSQLNWGLFGVLTVQLYMYHQAQYTDHPFVKCVVYGLYLFEALQTILLTHDTFHQLAYNWGNFNGLTAAYLTGFELVIQSSIIASVTQCFYAWRIYVLGNSRILAGLIVAVSLLQCGGGISEGIACFIYDSTSETIPIEATSVAIWVGGSAACDILITTSMVYFLWTKRSGVQKTDTMINKLIQLVVETGLMTAALAVIQLSLYMTFKKTEYFMTPAGALSKAYSNSLLVLLNNRRAIRMARDNITMGGSVALPQLQTTRAIQINVNQETFAEGNMAAVDLSSDKSQYDEYPKVDRA
ncbi:hypothetical protein DAEQUDRAFT_724345 [Daedalea quercina L-15889]|uniref:DUF6534 domain-containing protein n=1 Tax=Daedalea quercina L-15889 TaxID=1314783 RepID=A0A165S0B6_9APHY|nr:hypothetical protein DAEQUDRAFT_724345 [Daedalea quercina L-15889]